MLSYGKDSSMWKQFSTMENFILAQKNSRKHKTSYDEVKNFEKNLAKNLKDLRETVLTGRFTTSPYKSRTIYEPKERIIYILPYSPDRIVQHALLNVLIPYFLRMFSYDSYACVEGKGQIKASLRTMEMVRNYKYCLECDIHHAYPSVNQQILSNMYHEKFRDEKFLKILDNILFSFPGGHNIPIGNVTSQWSFNFYMTPLDLFCKHTLKVPEIRYSDNFNLYSNNKAFLHDCRKRIEDFIGKRELTFSKSNVFDVRQGVDFVGYRHFNNYILVRKSTAKRQMRNLKKTIQEYENGEITIETFRSTIDSILGWWKYAQTYNLQKVTQIKEIRRKYCA